MAPTSPQILFRFGVYEADANTGELRKSGVRLRLQEQPFQVLLMLLERPGELVTREEIRQRLWPADTFVDFDHSLNTVINKLRETLGDSASNPRFVETLARRGYRFLAPVERIPAGAVPAATPAGNVQPPASAGSKMTRVEPRPAEKTTAAPAAVPQNAAATSVLTQADEVPAVARRHVRVLFFLIQLMYLCFYIAALARLAQVQDLLQRALQHHEWLIVILIASAAIGIPVRLYLIAAVAFDVRGLTGKFRTLFPVLFPLDELWALSPFLLTPQIGLGLALAASAALIYVPFSERTLLLMGDRHATESRM